MLALIQRVSKAAVTVEGKELARIDQGILALIGVMKEDEVDQADRLLDKILQYRIFSDEAGKMNLSLQDVQGGLLLVPQFTLAADTQKGKRPSFSSAMPPAESEHLFTYLLEQAKGRHPVVGSGQFGAHMMVSLCNDGPVTFLLEAN